MEWSSTLYTSNAIKFVVERRVCALCIVHTYAVCFIRWCYIILFSLCFIVKFDFFHNGFFVFSFLFIFPFVKNNFFLSMLLFIGSFHQMEMSLALCTLSVQNFRSLCFKYIASLFIVQLHIEWLQSNSLFFC